MIQRKPRALQEADQAFKLASTAEELGDVSRGGLHPLSLSFLTGKVGAGLPRLEVVVILWWDEGAWELEAVTAPSDCRTLTASPCCCQETADQRGSMTSPKSHSQLILKPERESELSSKATFQNVCMAVQSPGLGAIVWFLKVLSPNQQQRHHWGGWRG